jgi:hypothetical protein
MFLAAFRPRFLLALSLLAAPLASGAVTLSCVHDVEELRAAIDAAAGSSDTPIVINLRSGTYDLSTASSQVYLRLLHTNQLVGISGGWQGDNGACTTQTKGADATVIVGAGAQRALWVNTDPTNSHTNIGVYVSDLTLRNPTGTGYGVCMAVTVSPGNSFSGERLRMDQCDSQDSGQATAILSNSGGQLSLVDVAASNGHSAVNNGGIGVSTTNGGTTRLSQLSITGMSSDVGATACNGLSISNPNNDGSSSSLSNSVVAGNDTDFDTKDLCVVGAGTQLKRVHYGSLSGTATSETASSSGDPGFVAAGDPHLRSDSALIDSGVSDPIGGSGSYDVAGKPRLQGLAVDVGAFEWSDGIFAAGFEP